MSLRERWFVGGRIGDLGLALLAIWLAVQVNPGIPLFAIVFDPAAEFGAAGALPGSGDTDIAAALVEGAHSAFQLLGVGLFLSLLLRERRNVGGAVLLLIGAALLAKGIAALFLLKPAVVGALAVARRVHRRRRRRAPAARRHLAATARAGRRRDGRAALVAADHAARAGSAVRAAPLSMFSWSYGHLLHFNGLTHIVLLAWPLRRERIPVRARRAAELGQPARSSED